MLTAGTRLDHYTITGYLGAGGMGAVYSAHDESLDRPVAIKVLPAREVADRDAVQRFRQEARAASALNHPNIVHIYAIDEAEAGGARVPYIAMELVDGVTLRARMEAGASQEELLGAVAQVAEAMAKAHECGIVHRDLKPENIMVHRDGYVKIVDFGLAKLLEPRIVQAAADARTEPLLPAAGAVRGTAAYMSPEQVRGEEADERSDVFSLGCILYEAASGRRPFEGGSTLDTLWNIAHAAAPPLTGVHPEWERVVSRCMEKLPEHRYPSARLLARELRELQRSAGSLPAASAATVPPRRSRRKVAYAAAAVALAVLALLGFILTRVKPPAIASVAVLPFRNVKPEVDYLSDGLTESLIAALAETTPLRVMSRASVFRFKNGPVSPVDAGRALRVGAVLTGDVETRGDRLTVRAELIDVADGSRIWGHRYEAATGSILGVQEAISRDVAERLHPSRRAPPQRSSTDDPEAYRLYLKGRYYWNKRNADGLTRAAAEFRAALDRDPTYARAWAGLADSFALLEQYAGVPSSETCPKAKAAALRAVEIDPLLAEPHATLGLLYAHCEWNWAESEREFLRAIQLNPNYATTHHWYALHLAYRGEFQRALAEARRAQELDPLSLIANNALAVVQAYARDYEAVLEQCRRNAEMDPGFAVTYLWIGRAKRGQKKYGQAIAALQTAERLSQGRSLEALADLGNTYAVAGRRAEALATLQRLTKQNAASAHYHLATIHAGLGDRDRALAELTLAVASHSWFLVQLGADPQWDALRGDPRFEQMRSGVFR